MLQEEGARTTLFAALAPPGDELAECTYNYFDGCKCKTPSDDALNPLLQRKMWNFSLSAVAAYAAPIATVVRMPATCGAA